MRHPSRTWSDCEGDTEQNKLRIKPCPTMSLLKRARSSTSRWKHPVPRRLEHGPHALAAPHLRPSGWSDSYGEAAPWTASVCAGD